MTKLCHQHWPSEEMLPKVVDVPILFLSGLKDEIIPYVHRPLAHAMLTAVLIRSSPSHMAELHRICTSNAKVWRTFANGHHNDTVSEPGYFESIHSFVVNEVLE
jgi:predicted esterase